MLQQVERVIKNEQLNLISSPNYARRKSAKDRQQRIQDDSADLLRKDFEDAVPLDVWNYDYATADG